MVVIPAAGHKYLPPALAIIAKKPENPSCRVELEARGPPWLKRISLISPAIPENS
jgi:hypothetical protein